MFTREMKKHWNTKVTVIQIVTDTLGTIGGIGGLRKNRDHPVHSLIKVNWNIYKTSGDLSRLLPI